MGFFKKSMSVRELAIIELIHNSKRHGIELISLDWIAEKLKQLEKEYPDKRGVYPKQNVRRNIMSTMNGLMPKLNSFGIYIEKETKLGRGNKASFRIIKETK